VSSRSGVITRSAAKLEAPPPPSTPQAANLTEVMLLSETCNVPRFAVGDQLISGDALRAHQA
jgi:hypothetical protein